MLDVEGEMAAEYHRHLNPSGQPGVGDQFYLIILNSAPWLVERCELLKREDGEYADLPQQLIDANFDPSDRKFAALAKSKNVLVVNATDSDWCEHRDLLRAVRIQVKYLCGCNTAAWFSA